MGSGSTFLGVPTSIYVEFMRFLYALNHVWMVDFQRLWLESDSTLVCHDFLY